MDETGENEVKPAAKEPAKKKGKQKKQGSSDGCAQKSKKTASKAGDQKESAEARERKAKLETKIRDRVASEARAFDVVNRLIEAAVSPDYLQQACQYIDHNHYQDVVEERAISHLCGYPLCDKQLGQVAKKKYHISTRTNTVYDITERKNYCSNGCYRASKHLLKQIPDTPVWTRRDTTIFTIDLIQHQDPRSMEGEEVIGSSSFSLKKEVQLLEQMDRLNVNNNSTSDALSRWAKKPMETKKTTTVVKKMSSSAESDLSSGMAAMLVEAESDGRDQQEGEPGIGDNLHHSLAALALEDDREKLKFRENEKKVGKYNFSDTGPDVITSHQVPDQDFEGHGSTRTTSKSLLSCANTVPASISKTAVDSDDDDDDDIVSNRPATTVVDSDDSEINGVSSGQIHENKFISEDEKLLGKSNANSESDSSLVTKSMEAEGIGSEIQGYAAEGPLKTSGVNDPTNKANYLAELLDRRKDLLAKVADIQTSFSNKKSPASPDKINIEAVDSKAKVGYDEGRSVNQSLQSAESAQKHSRDQHLADGCSSGSQKNTVNPNVTLAKIEGNNAEARLTVPVKPKSRKKEKSQSASRPQASPSAVSTSPTTNSTTIHPVLAACQFFSQWVTSETLTFLGVSQSESEGRRSFLDDPQMESKYHALCQRLAAQEKDFDDLLGEEEVKEKEWSGPSQPLPHFNDLKKQTAEFQLKVAQFLHSSAEGEILKSKKTTTNDQANDVDNKDGSNERPIQLPVVDSHNQMLIRRRIVLERLNRAMSSLLPLLGLSVQDVSSLLRELVFTFRLSSGNIVLKPTEWTLVSLVLLTVLGSKNASVKQALEKTSPLNSVLGQLGHSASSLGQLVTQTLNQCHERLEVEAD